MEIPRYLSVLWQYRVLLLIGVLISAGTGFFAAFTVSSEGIEPRGEKTYTASTAILLSNEEGSMFRTEVPGSAVEEGVTTPTRSDLAQAAVLYAYLISGKDILASVEGDIGALAEGESLSALRRTTQPGSSDQASGRLNLPIVEIYGQSSDPARAIAIAATANRMFLAYVEQEQEAHGVDPADRVVLDTISDPEAVLDSGGNPLAPALLVGLAVMMMFVVGVFVIDNIRTRRRPRSPRREARASRGGRATSHDRDSTEADPSPDEMRVPPEFVEHVGTGR
jgi:capsular polysaccharide biosynthesis protein